MTQEVFERGDWQAVIDAHRLESHDAAEWLRYGSALLHSMKPGPEAGKQQQQAALAFVQAQREGASTGAVAAAQRQAVMSSLRQVLQLVGIPGPKKLPWWARWLDQGGAPLSGEEVTRLPSGLGPEQPGWRYTNRRRTTCSPSGACA